ncbi:lysozyme inhibitor LprI family protein [Vibrio coralliirubri]|uniref:lysozyme inhibitor LprI family protein n=1 Tax=Vibrio coralliirubri TaxID=1516159 RepID=UPI00069C303F|nr:lysozyme inhibitor LprI family protein [Vibrio coralliirubri]
MKKLISALIAVCFSFSALADEGIVDCENAMNTIEINQCAAIELESAQAELDKYLAASFEHNAYDAELVASIKKAQESWQAYMTAHCDSVYTQWRDGSIQGVMALSCKTTLTKQRTHEVWANFLTYMDSTPPVLPEPKLAP